MVCGLSRSHLLDHKVLVLRSKLRSTSGFRDLPLHYRSVVPSLGPIEPDHGRLFGTPVGLSRPRVHLPENRLSDRGCRSVGSVGSSKTGIRIFTVRTKRINFGNGCDSGNGKPGLFPLAGGLKASRSGRAGTEPLPQGKVCLGTPSGRKTGYREK